MSRIGRLHHLESCGAVDGPGIRFLVFLQGCVMRCQYCHNRDSWDLKGGREVCVEEVMAEARTYLPFMRASGGGITCSGGEALLQPAFVRDLFVAAKAEGMHTCLDTNGYACHYDDVLDALLDATDLVLLDIKHIEEGAHRVLTGISSRRPFAFARHLAAIGKPTWIRQVIVPGHTDSDEMMHRLGQFIQTLDNIERVELLPYHGLGEYKWEELGQHYPLAGLEPPSRETMERLVAIAARYHPQVVAG
ncbi:MULTISPECIES: pyruvate formate-lyase-activating protein [Halomonas]|uniref:pyruvate formate-lyase-activating protein n=1 Tax=Halomonas TaxID=2745 RepID=UPI001C95FACC|nr:MULTISPECIES: pyruvate formate-lyase-activating protein [Halomonas]MBY6209492.1 pyruvate formate lyase-activating protein [Halomonas sp. DP3Y7-2]MBY6230584.1 pyruvate formate lyase-activating protein [Halomonas sp. DP3Y7-1]MCA0918688.1 pyruvate formate lyase-activating protein [Halomonas denitrificans]